jgi:hypothetical protein
VENTTRLKLRLLEIIPPTIKLNYCIRPGTTYCDFALENFKIKLIRGDGNCLMNCLMWWVINYHTADPTLFGPISTKIDLMNIIGGDVNLKNKKMLKNPIDAKEVLELFGDEKLDVDTKYNKSPKNIVITKINQDGNIINGKEHVGNEYYEHKIECTTLAGILRRELIKVFYDKLVGKSDNENGETRLTEDEQILQNQN